MTVEHELDSLVSKLSLDLHRQPNAKCIDTYTRNRTERHVTTDRNRRTPSEERAFNRDQWYAMGQPNNSTQTSTTTQQPLTPILKRRDVLSPNSNQSHSPRARKQLNFLLDSEARSPTYCYESDRSPSPRPRSTSPHRSVGGPVAKADYYRHRDSSHAKPLPGDNAYMGPNWRRANLESWESPRRSPIPFGSENQRQRSCSPLPSGDRYGGDRYGGDRYGGDRYGGGRDTPDRLGNDRFLDNGGLSAGRTNGGRESGFGGSQPDLRSLGRPDLDQDNDLNRSRDSLGGSCQDIDRKGRFLNLPSNWEKSIEFFEQKREQLPAQRIKSVEPLNNYVKREPVKLTESTPNLVAALSAQSRKPGNDIPPWMRQLKHIVIEQMPLPVPPRFGTLLHGRRNADYSMAAPINGPPCHLCHEPITETRCIRSFEHNFHCWHFVCSFCNKTLPEFDFTMAPDNRPYCLNCFKRYFP